MLVQIQPLSMGDYEAVFRLWTDSEGLSIREVDSREAIERFLERNPGLSYVARVGATVVGSVLCGHDGRRGYLHHVVVAEQYRRRGIATLLVKASLESLLKEGIEKCHLFVFEGNEVAKAFWASIGWTLRRDINVMSFIMGPSANA